MRRRARKRSIDNSVKAVSSIRYQLSSLLYTNGVLLYLRWIGSNPSLKCWSYIDESVQERRNSGALSHRYREYILFFIDYIIVIELMVVNASNVFNWLRPRQDGWLRADSIFTCVFLNKTVFTLIRISLKPVPKWPSDTFLFPKSLNQPFTFSENWGKVSAT